MLYILESADLPLKKDHYINHKINIFYQFFIHSDRERQKELLFCLKKNVQNPHIDKIFLLNERVYTRDELGQINSDKIIQININKRLQYADVFNYIDNNKINGFFCIINSDIFFDETLKNLLLTKLDEEQYMFSQLRYEYDNIKQSSIIYGPSCLSQDTWIFHSKFIKEIMNNNDHFKIELGKPGCDNRISYLLNIIGFKIINYPIFIKTYHYHTTKIRNYCEKDRIEFPYCGIKPKKYQVICNEEIYSTVLKNDNIVLYNYIKEKLISNKKFVIPSFSIVNEIILYRSDNNILNNVFKSCDICPDNWKNNYMLYLMLNYNKSSTVIDLDMYNKTIKSIKDIMGNKTSINVLLLEHVNNMYDKEWITALQNIKLLIISPLIEKIREKISYRIDNFINCEFILLNQPDKKDSKEDDIFNVYCDMLDIYKDSYDVALISCDNGYCLQLCNYIYEKHNKSAISFRNIHNYFNIL
jgi:hypothetical protein